MCIHYLGFILLSWDTMTKSNFGSTSQAFRTGTEGRDHGGVPLSSLFLMTCSTCFLTQLRPTAQGVMLLTMSGAPFHQLTKKKKKCPYRLPYSPSGWKSFLSWSSLIQNGSILCQAEVKIASITDLSVRHTNKSLLNHNLSSIVHPQDLILALELQYKTSQLLNVFKNPDSLKVQSL